MQEITLKPQEITLKPQGIKLIDPRRTSLVPATIPKTDRSGAAPVRRETKRQIRG